MTRRRPGPSVRLRLTLTFAAVVVVTGTLLLAVVWLFLLRYVPSGSIDTARNFVPNRRDLVRAFAPAAAVVLVALLALGTVGGWFLARRVLAPLDRIAEATRLVASGSLSHRVAMAGRDDEFRELADAFDGMLARLESDVGAQQRFAANASHELRTPLAITQSLLDVAERDPGRDPATLVARLRSVNTRAVDLTEALLLLSRSEQHAVAHEPLDLSLLAEEAVETLLPLAEADAVDLRVDTGPAPTAGSPALLLQLVTNLVHNGIVHNGPDAQGARWIGVRTGTEDGRAVLEVRNSGATVPQDVVPTLTEPFQRGAARTRSGTGTGLGLAIVAAVVRAHDGELELAAPADGGLAVTVRLGR